MKILLNGLLVLSLIVFIAAFLVATGADIVTAEHYEAPEAPKTLLNLPQRAWLGALEWCESGGRAYAINPKDLDNTPSYGLLQFKPETFAAFAKRYGIEGNLMNAEAQEKIVEQMIIRGDVNWRQQFPDCVARLGTPPKAIHTER